MELQKLGPASTLRIASCRQLSSQAYEQTISIEITSKVCDDCDGTLLRNPLGTIFFATGASVYKSYKCRCMFFQNLIVVTVEAMFLKLQEYTFRLAPRPIR